MRANDNREPWNHGIFYPLGLFGYPQIFGRIGMQFQGVNFCSPPSSSAPVPALIYAPQNNLPNIFIPPPNSPEEKAVEEELLKSKKQRKMIKSSRSGNEGSVSQGSQFDKDSIIISRNPDINTNLKIILQESSVLFKDNLKLNEETLAKVMFRTKWQTTMTDLILLGNHFEEEDAYHNAINQYRHHIDYGSATRATWITLGHCYLLRHYSAEAYKSYKEGFFQDNICLDVELWYIIGILFHTVNLFLSFS